MRFKVQLINNSKKLYIPGIPAGSPSGAVNCIQKAGKDGNGYKTSETSFETAGTPSDAGSLHNLYHRQADLSNLSAYVIGLLVLVCGIQQAYLREWLDVAILISSMAQSKQRSHPIG